MAQIWIMIANRTTSLGVAQKTANEVKEKWINTKKVAKKHSLKAKEKPARPTGSPNPRILAKLFKKPLTCVNIAPPLKVSAAGLKLQLAQCER